MAAGFTERIAAAWQRARSRYGSLDHMVRAGSRYDEADGGRLAAAVTYYAFFATFALALLGFAVFGFILDDPVVLRSVQRYLAQNLPRLDVRALRDARGTAGVIAFVGLPVTGWFWVDALRSSIRKVWRLPEYPGNFFIRLLIDLLVLAGLGLLLAASIAVALGTAALASRLIDAVGTAATPERWLVDAALGGLNYQIEHHLSPSMPRPNLRRSQALVRSFCQQHHISYCETTLLRSYAQALRHLHEAGRPLRATAG
jgi:membrane protein